MPSSSGHTDRNMATVKIMGCYRKKKKKKKSWVGREGAEVW